MKKSESVTNSSDGPCSLGMKKSESVTNSSDGPCSLGMKESESHIIIVLHADRSKWSYSISCVFNPQNFKLYLSGRTEKMVLIRFHPMFVTHQQCRQKLNIRYGFAVGLSGGCDFRLTLQ